jgi:hypothetical protein
MGVPFAEILAASACCGIGIVAIPVAWMLWKGSKIRRSESEDEQDGLSP